MMPFKFPHKGEKALVMGIINVSPDSFYRESRCTTVDQAISKAKGMIKEGVDILDIGAESSRPGSVSISEQEELDRLMPVLAKLVKVTKVPISVDTYKPVVAQKVLQSGASIINDITGLQRFEGMAKIISQYDAGLILMHMQGTPEYMQDQPQYADVISEILEYLQRFKELAKPVLLGISRKSLIGNILNVSAEERLEGSLAAIVFGLIQGASIIRTHDVQATQRTIKVVQEIIKA